MNITFKVGIRIPNQTYNMYKASDHIESNACINVGSDIGMNMQCDSLMSRQFDTSMLFDEHSTRHKCQYIM